MGVSRKRRPVTVTREQWEALEAGEEVEVEVRLGARRFDSYEVFFDGERMRAEGVRIKALRKMVIRRV